MATNTRTVLGIDASTQSLSAVLLQGSTGEIVWSRSLPYRDDPRLLGLGFEHDTMIMPPREAGEAELADKGILVLASFIFLLRMI